MYIINATKVFNSGKFLFPREFGVDPTYTFIARNQIEGQGNASCIGLAFRKEIKNLEMKLDWSQMRSDEQIKYNKYKLSSYNQINAECNYNFKGSLDGLHLRFLYVYRKYPADDLPQSAQFNQASFNQFNLVANFNFSAALQPKEVIKHH
ncbi:hypothetical protein OAD66_07980 [Bacteroidia bacterium]|nr:hypothetical protein [Bacteroidia bacterium]